MNILIYLIFLLLITSIDSLIFNKLFIIKNNKKKKEIYTNYNYIDKNKIFLYKIEDNECGHCKIQKKFSPFAKTFTNLKEGSCQENGYTDYTGCEQINVPVLGKLKIEKFIKINTKNFK